MGAVTVLLDTHALLWWLAGDDRLSEGVRTTVADEAAEVLVSAATAWEIATKVRIGKLPGAEAVAADLLSILRSQAFRGLDVTLEHARLAGALPGPHRDPFDRMLIAQSRIEGVAVATLDPVFAAYGVDTLW